MPTITVRKTTKHKVDVPTNAELNHAVRESGGTVPAGVNIARSGNDSATITYTGDMDRASYKHNLVNYCRRNNKQLHMDTWEIS